MRNFEKYGFWEQLVFKDLIFDWFFWFRKLKMPNSISTVLLGISGECRIIHFERRSRIGSWNKRFKYVSIKLFTFLPMLIEISLSNGKRWRKWSNKSPFGTILEMRRFNKSRDFPQFNETIPMPLLLNAYCSENF